MRSSLQGEGSGLRESRGASLASVKIKEISNSLRKGKSRVPGPTTNLTYSTLRSSSKLVDPSSYPTTDAFFKTMPSYTSRPSFPSSQTHIPSLNFSKVLKSQISVLRDILKKEVETNTLFIERKYKEVKEAQKQFYRIEEEMINTRDMLVKEICKR